MHPLIHDWNRTGAPKPPTVLLDDETLRDGLQSPSVRCPTIDEKLRILHLIDRLGIETADLGLPGAGPHVVRDVERLAREIADQRLKVEANCAARTVIADIRPIAEISQRVGLPKTRRARTRTRCARCTRRPFAPARSASASPTRSATPRPTARRRSSGSSRPSSTTAAGGSASIGTATGTGTSPSSIRWPPSRRARRGCTARRSASASGSATRRWSCCW